MSYKAMPGVLIRHGDLTAKHPHDLCLCFSVEEGGSTHPVRKFGGEFLDIYITKEQAIHLRDSLTHWLEDAEEQKSNN